MTDTIQILKRAKEMGDYLIVGVTSENYDKSRGKLNVEQSLVERIENVKKSGFADKIIVEEVRPEGGYGVGNQKTHKALMYLQAAINFMLYDDFNKKEMELIYPSS